MNIQPTHGQVGTAWGMREGDPITGAIGDYNKEVVATYPYLDTVSTTNVRFKYDCGHAWSGFTPISIYFAGLSNQTTLELRVRAIVEYFPTPSEALISLSSPSPIYDPVAFQAYALIARNAPYAVPVGYNMDSKYFKMVLQVLSNAGLAAPLLNAIPVAGQILALGAHGVATLSQMGLAALEGKKIQRDQAGAAAMPNVTYGDMSSAHSLVASRRRRNPRGALSSVARDVAQRSQGWEWPLRPAAQAILRTPAHQIPGRMVCNAVPPVLPCPWEGCEPV
jgi:hypothetical protein